jgi:multiple sugar transport system ATP-binding protein
MAKVVLKNLTKIYSGNVKVVSNVNLEIEDKEFIVLVGPSGCGKSTTLRMIAGLEEITDGEIFIDNKCVNNVPPKDRDIAMVFQNYALYPHMTVFENMAFGLKIRKLPKDEILKRVNEAAEILELQNLLERKPKQLSGGQRQRVALGRAIVRKPKVFLFDEPLSNLDAKLRVQMRTEISKLHQKLGVTMIYVTHDQTEAMTMGERIVVMNAGQIEQIDTPLNIYNYPKNKFVAGFIGSPPMNFIDGEIIAQNKIKIVSTGTELTLTKEYGDFIEKNMNKKVILGIRPEDINITEKEGILSLMPEVIEPLGNETLIYFKLNNSQIIVRAEASQKFKLQKQIQLKFKSEKIHLFSPK